MWHLDQPTLFMFLRSNSESLIGLLASSFCHMVQSAVAKSLVQLPGWSVNAPPKSCACLCSCIPSLACLYLPAVLQTCTGCFLPSERCQCSYRPFYPRLPSVWLFGKAYLLHYVALNRPLESLALIDIFCPAFISLSPVSVTPRSFAPSETCRSLSVGTFSHVILDFLSGYAQGPAVYFMPG